MPPRHPEQCRTLPVLVPATSPSSSQPPEGCWPIPRRPSAADFSRVTRRWSAMACRASFMIGISRSRKRQKSPSAFRKLWAPVGIRCRGSQEEKRCEVRFMADTDYAAGTDYTAEADYTAGTDATPDAVSLPPSGLNRALLAIVRIGVGLLWLQNVGWKTPPNFGRGNPPGGLYLSASYA